MNRRFRIAVVSAGLLVGLGVPMFPASAAGTGSISGVAFEDSNRNGVRDAGEATRSGEALNLFNAAGTAIAATTTAADGSYTFPNLAVGNYSVAYTPSAWRGVRNDFAPTTSSSTERPSLAATVPGSPVNFGWRRIVRSTTVGAPVSSFVGPQGLTVESYNDVTDARQLYDLLVQGTVGREATNVVVRLDVSASTVTSTAVGASNGTYDVYSAVCYISWATWLDRGAAALAHEYGHAWSLYYAHLVQQDPTLAGYVRARGLEGDARLGSTADWSPREMIAEDYRQLLGSPSGQPMAQANRDIPLASQVSGLADYLNGAFQQSNASPSPSPSPSPSATPEPTESPSPSASPSTTTTPSPTVSASATPTSSPTASPSPSSSPSPASSTKGRGGSTTTCRKC
jgi:hypothetical protein